MLHVKKLLEASAKAKGGINHLFYLVDPGNARLSDYLRAIAAGNPHVTLVTRNENGFTEFKRLRKKAPYGGDCNYDFLIRRPETREVFLTLHDDAIMLTDDLHRDLEAALSGCDFAGYIDSRGEIDSYRRIIMDGKPMSELRLGTWFTAGRKDLYLSRNYRIGDYRNYWKYHLMVRYGFTKRLKFLDQKVWLNGGFDFNIRARLEGLKLRILDKETSIPPMAMHLTKITGFFAATKRNMLQYADSDQEVERWLEYARNLQAKGDLTQIDFDRKFMLDLSGTFEEAGISDPLLNRAMILEIFGAPKGNEVEIAGC